MYPILARFSGGFLYSYTAVWGVAILFTLGQIAWLNRRPHFQLTGWFDAAVCALLGGLLGGRLSFLAANAAYFQQHPTEIRQLWQGGYEPAGAMLGALLLFGLWGWVRGKRGGSKGHIAPYAALFTPSLALLYAAGWLACGLEGCGAGQEAFLNWYTADLPDQFGVYAVRYPVQWWGTAVGLLLWAWLSWRAHQPRFAQRLAGFWFWLTLLLLSLCHLFLMQWQLDVWLVAEGVAAVTALFSALFLVRISKNPDHWRI